jgi:hypothetical protein
MIMSWAISEGIELPFTLCAGVGRAVVIEVMELVMLVIRSLVLGDNCEGLCGVCGWNDMMDRRGRAMERSRSEGWAGVATPNKEKSQGLSAARCFEVCQKRPMRSMVERRGRSAVDGGGCPGRLARKRRNGYRRRSVHNIHSSFGSARRYQSINTKFQCRRKIAAAVDGSDVDFTLVAGLVAALSDCEGSDTGGEV